MPRLSPERARLALFFVCLLVTPFLRAQAPAQEDPAVTTLLRTIYSQLRSGTLDKTLLAPQLAADTTPEDLAQAREGLNQLGDPTRIAVEVRTPVQGGVKYLYAVTFAIAQFKFWIYITTDGKVGGYRLL